MKAATVMAIMLTVIGALLVGCATAPTSRAEREALVAEGTSSLQQMRAEDPGLSELVRRSYGYAIFPNVTKGGLGVGGAYGRGVVYEQGRQVGYSDLSHASLGLQAGGQTFSELLLFENKDALDRFKAGQFNFGADASAVVMESGAATNVHFVDGVAVVVRPTGGAMVEAAVGGQNFTYQAL
jgi:lipid-binding SYLF domain-containing protein